MASGSYDMCNIRVMAVVCLLGIMVGCEKPGLDRLEIDGNVTWKGQPVPAGRVYFTPDEMKGGSGPQGYATIVNGRYDSNAESSKGCLAGPHVAEVHGFDGQGGSGFGSPLFAAQQIAIDIPAEGGTIDLVVPENAPPAVPVSDE